MGNTASGISVLITDSQDHKLLTLQVINCLSLSKDVKIYLMSSDKYNYLKFSRHVKHVSFYPKTTDENWINHINTEVEKHKIDVIMPIFEIGIRRLIKNKDLLLHKDKLCKLTNLSNYDIAANKGDLYLHLEANGFPCPKSVISKPNEIPNLETLKFPIIAKPVIGFGGGQQIEVLTNKEDVISYVKQTKFGCNAIYQNFVYGYDLCCNVLCNNGEVTAYSIQKASVFLNNEVTPQIGFEFVQESELLDVIKKVMKSLDWSGVANIDCRYDEKEGFFKIIEINTRFWINVDASAVAKVNFPYLYCLQSLNLNHDFKTAEPISYLNLKGMVRQIAKKPSTLFKPAYLKNNTPIMFALNDPLPMIYKLVWRTKNIIVGTFKSD